MQYIRKANYATFCFEITLADGSAEDLSETILKFVVKKNKADDDTAAILADAISYSDTNIVLFQFDATQTANLEEGTYYAALKMFFDISMFMFILLWGAFCFVRNFFQLVERSTILKIELPPYIPIQVKSFAK